MTLDRYLLREIGVPFLLGLFGLTTVFMINQFVRLADLFVGRGMSLEALLNIVAVLVPPFLLVTLPAAVLLAGIVAFSRLSADSEIVAMKANGISFARMMRPVFLFAAVVGCAALALGLTAQPWGHGKLKHLAMETIKAHAGLAITPGAFNDSFGDVVVFAEEATESGHLRHIFIADERDPDRPLLVTAREGSLVQTPNQDEFGFHLTSGEIYRQGNAVQRVRFDEYDVKLRLQESGADTYATLGEVKRELDRRRASGEPLGSMLQLRMDHTKNVTFGVAAFIFGLLGPALGVHGVRTGRMGGFTQGIILILAYYVLLTFAQAMVVGERIPVGVGAWAPNTVFLLATLYVVWRAQRELPLLPKSPFRRRAA